MFNDEATIEIKAGKGGDGAVSFRREKYVPKGGPDGGDGGKGGDIYFKVDGAVHTLADYARKKEWAGENGEAGRPKRQHGKDGEDLYLKVPPGTKIEIIGGETEKSGNTEIYDLTTEGQEIKIARGGRGGWGNVHFATATSQSPLYAKKGEPGEEKHLKLELRLIADVGLVGLPNAGKSTFLSRVSNARPKIAAYPFTTIVPNLGVAKYRDREIILADIPGLIEGASRGKGLGDKFLRHIERTKILIHLIDITSADPARDYQTIRGELKAWNPELLNKPEIVVLNKSDTLDKKATQKIASDLHRKIKKEIYLISAVSGEGIDKIFNELNKKL